MGKMEEESTRRTRKNELQKIILQTVKVAGLLSLAFVAPNVIGVMAKLGLIQSPRQGGVVERTSDRLVRKGLMEWREGKLRLTQKGEHKLIELELRESVKRPRRWDRKWRVLIFDIPEKRKGLRQKVRNTLSGIGFVHLQHSVWVYPYDCEDLVALLKADFHVGDDVLYMIVDSIERDVRIKNHFKLS